MAPSFERTPSQEAAIDELRAKLEGSLRSVHDDFALLQWLELFVMDVNRTAEAIKKSNDVIARYQLEQYEAKEVIRDYYSGGLIGCDKEGGTVKIELLGRLDLKGLMRSCTKFDMERHKFCEYESMCMDMIARSQASGKRVHGLTTIVDMEGVGSEWLWRPGLQIYLELINLIEEHYPGTIKRIIVINAPNIFPLLWRIAKTFMREDIKNKLEVIGCDFKDTLLKYIEADQLPAFLGGNMTDPDGNPRCPSQICQGGKVPVSLYTPLETEMQGMQVKLIPNGQKFCLNFDVSEPGVILGWSFRTDDNDIGFGVFHKEDEDTTEVLPIKRVPSHHVIEAGSLVCQKVGTYEVCFDNSFSWATPKRLYYHVEIHMTDDEVIEELNKMATGGSWADVVLAK